MGRIETAQKHLEEVGKADRLIRLKKDEIENIRRDLIRTESYRTDRERVQRSPRSDESASKIADLVDLMRDAENDIEMYVEIKSGIVREIEKLPDPDEKAILFYYYVEGMTYDSIAEKLQYSTRQIYRKRDKALQSFVSLNGIY